MPVYADTTLFEPTDSSVQCRQEAFQNYVEHLAFEEFVLAMINEKQIIAWTRVMSATDVG